MAEGHFILGTRLFMFGVFSAVLGDDSIATTVPNILHQKWKRAPIPESLLPAYEDCQKHIKNDVNFTYKLWTDEDVEELIVKEYPWFTKTFKSYSYDIQRIDVAKYFILYHYGGIYLDLDIQCKVDLSQILKKHSAYPIILAPTTPVGVATDLLITTAKNPFFFQLINDLNKTSSKWYIVPYITIMWTTGPMYVTNHVWDYQRQENILILEKELYQNIYFNNFHFSSWHRWDGILIWNVYRMRHYVLFILLLTAVVKFLRFIRKHRLGMHRKA